MTAMRPKGTCSITAPEPDVGIDRRTDDEDLTPAGLQDRRALFARRFLFAALNLTTLAAMTWGIAQVFSPGGWSATDIMFVACFLLAAPWVVLGLWNAVIGTWLLHGQRDGLALVAPHVPAGETDAPIASRVAMAMTLRNEDPLPSYQRLAVMRAELDATEWGHLFDIFILSDTSEQAIAEEEERLFHAMRSELGGARARYRRRTENVGFKAGNVHEFVMTHGRGYDLYLPLDSDSLMSAKMILKMVRIMEAYPRIGILQSLIVALPAQTAFTRIFQFGMRHLMRPVTYGATWWVGDCNSYWGHNALIRMAPFREHCRLPVLPGEPPLGGYILSHDQVEAVLMRRAGYEVRIIPLEDESWEGNPPTLVEFIKRELRWCQGNMQYSRLVGLRGLLGVSRVQLITAITQYLSPLGWILITLTGVAKLFEGDMAGTNVTFGIAMFFIMLAASLVPKLMGMLDLALTRGATQRYGGRWRVAAGMLTEILFSVLLAPVVALSVTIFLIGLAFGKSVSWNGQQRGAAHGISWRDAARGAWPQTLYGLALFVVIAIGAGVGTLKWAAPLIAGMALAIPFAVLTADPRISRWTSRTGLCAVSDELAMPETLARLERIEKDGDEYETSSKKAA